MKGEDRMLRRYTILRVCRRFWPLLAVVWAFILCGCPKVARAQVPVTLGPDAIATFIGTSGAPLANGYVCTFAAGTTTPQATYTDSTGTVQNANPTVLNAAGRANIWFIASAYKIVLHDSGGDGTCGPGGGTVEFTTDNFQVAPFLAGNNSWTGNQTFAGTSTFNGAVTFTAGGAMSGTFTGSPTLSGNPTFTGSPTFTTGTPTFANGAKIDVLTGTIVTGGTFTVTGANGTGANNGEGISAIAGNGGPTGSGGAIQITSGKGGATSGNGGNLFLNGGNAQGSGAGGPVSLVGGTGAGGMGGAASLIAGPSSGNIGGASATLQAGAAATSGTGGFAIVQAGASGGTNANGGDVQITPTVGAGTGLNGRVTIAVGHLEYTNEQVPSCSATGIGATGTCTIATSSTDSDGFASLLPSGAGIAALGTVTITFQRAMGTQNFPCVFSLQNGGGSWNARATAIGTTFSTASGTAAWDNNSVALTAAVNVDVVYHCMGHN